VRRQDRGAGVSPENSLTVRGAPQRSPGSPPARADVVVVGGGLAGLAAGVTLARRGVDVALLEARSRVGGRVLTLRAPFAAGLFAEAGPEFISPGHQALRGWLRAYGVPVGPRRFGPRLFAFAGQTARGWWVDAFGGRVPADLERVAAATARDASRVLTPRTAWRGPDAAALDSRSLGAWIDEQDLGPVVRSYEHTWTRLDYGVEPEGLSLLTYARDERMLRAFADRPGTHALGGLDQLTTGMAADLGGRLHLATAATGFARAPDPVQVYYLRDGSVGEIEARYVVVAVPCTVLRTLAVTPPWQPARQRAIHGLRYSHVMKVHLQFRRRFWLDHDSSGVMTDLPLQSAWDSTGAQAGERGILTLYKAGRQVVALAALPEAERLARCLAQLEEVYPGCSAEFEVGTAVDWDADPASRGAYSHFAPGELTAFAPWLARPEGRIHFAGEHTDPWQATMNGALASGVRAAREVLRRLEAPAPS
jgi:monoamine oxidase